MHTIALLFCLWWGLFVFVEVTATRDESSEDHVDLRRFSHLPGHYPVHYKPYELYRNFSILTALAEWQHQEFNINYYDPLQGRLALSGAVNLWEHSVEDVVHHLCQALINPQLQAVDSFALLRCSVATSRTVRMRKMQVVSNISMYYSFAPFEDEIFAHLQAYESPLRSQNQNHDSATSGSSSDSSDRNGDVHGNVCLLGSPSPHVVLSMLVSPTVQHIRIFSRVHRASNNNGNSEVPVRDTQWDQVDMQQAAGFFSKTIQSFSYPSLLEEFWSHRSAPSGSDLANSCDFVHISADILPSATSKDNYVDSILPLVKFLGSGYFIHDGNDTHTKDWVPTARVVWQSLSTHEHAGSMGPASDHIEWKWSSTWFSLSYFGNERDSNGFFSVGYGTWQLQLPFRFTTIRIGYLKTTEQIEEENALMTGFFGESSAAVPEERNRVMFLITTPSRANLVTALSLQQQLKELGYPFVFVFPEITIGGFEEYERQARKIDVRLVHVVFDPTMLELTYRRHIIVHTSALDMALLFEEGRVRYKHMLTRALQVWHCDDWGAHQLRDLIALPRENRVFTVPLSRLSINRNIDWQTASPPFSDPSMEPNTNTLHVLFLPTDVHCSKHEIEVTQDLSQYQLQSSGLTMGRSIQLNFLCNVGVFDYEREFLLDRSHVLLSFPREQSNAHLNTLQLRQLLALNKPVVALKMETDVLPDELTHAAIVVNSVEHVWKELQALASSATYFTEQHQKATNLSISRANVELEKTTEITKRFLFSRI
jgi:hypothetical protein